jgi:hypothetical protein
MVIVSTLALHRLTRVEFAPKTGASMIFQLKFPNSFGQVSLRYSQVLEMMPENWSWLDAPVL